MKTLPSLALCLLAAPALMTLPAMAELPQGAELFTPPGLDGILSVETAEYRFGLSPVGDGGGYVLDGEGPSGAAISQPLGDDSPMQPDRLFLIDSNGCGGASIDLVIRLAPPETGDLRQYNYYRVVMQPDLGAIIAEFYDPSIAAANAVLPLQTVEDMRDPSTGQAITCEGTVPVVADR